MTDPEGRSGPDTSAATDRPGGPASTPPEAEGFTDQASAPVEVDADPGLLAEPSPVDGPSPVDEAVEEAEEAIAEDVSELALLTAERNEYLEQLRRLQADFENYKKRILKQQTEHLERAAEELITKLLPVLDNFDLALAHGTEGVEPVYRSLLDVLESAGLQRVDPMGQVFDPTEHDAVLHEADEDAADSSGVPEVVEVLRAGYRWRGRLLRPAMVKVKG